MKTILTIFGFIIIGYLFSTLKSKITSRFKNQVMNKIKKTNSSIGKVYKKDGTEIFQWNKFKKALHLHNKVEWAKDISSLFNLRKLIIYTVIISSFFGYGYWRGQQGKQINVNLGYEQAVEIQVPNSELRLYKPQNSSKLYWIDKDGNKISVTVADIPALKKALRPIAFEFVPVGILGAGMGLNNTGGEIGIGISFLRYWRANIEAFLTNRGIYFGTSYRLNFFNMKNSSVGLGIGKGFSNGENRAIVYYRWRF